MASYLEAGSDWEFFGEVFVTTFLLRYDLRREELFRLGLEMPH